MIKRSSLVALLALASCSEAVAPAAAPPAPLPAAIAAPSPSAPPPGIRLPTTVKPTRYAPTLTILSDTLGIEGSIDIDVALTEPTSIIWLNAVGLRVSEAHLEVAGVSRPARLVPGGADHLGFAFDMAPEGKARLHVTYSADVSERDDRGVFAEKEDGASYIFSQFENIDARRAFPCFDEPTFKVPWQLTLKVKQSDVALSNTPSLSEMPAEGGLKTVRFAETKPLPTYLVAFAVGPFDLVDAGRAGRGGTPLRIVVPHGKSAEAAYAVKTTPILLERLERFFGMAYPYEKLDVVAVPRLVSFGAMENVGLITFFERGVLAGRAEETLRFQRGYSETIAHEMAHQWFGDLVTMSFWNDIWLNEAFASWMEQKTIAPWKPEWSWETNTARSTAYAMRNDSLISARKIRQEILTKDDIQNAFDSITYNKGAAVIGMFETWVGPDKFQKGVQSYLTKHAHGSAGSSDFFAAISAEAGATWPSRSPPSSISRASPSSRPSWFASPRPLRRSCSRRSVISPRARRAPRPGPGKSRSASVTSRERRRIAPAPSSPALRPSCLWPAPPAPTGFSRTRAAAATTTWPMGRRISTRSSSPETSSRSPSASR